MGNSRSGRRRVPTETLKLRGARVRRPVATEPTFGVPGMPEPPAHLAEDPAALAAFASFGARLVAARVVTPAHAELLALLAEAWADYTRKRAEWRAMKWASVVVQTWTDSEGELRTRSVENPLVRQMRQQHELIVRIAGEFGLSPATASKVERLAASADDPDEAYFRNRAGPVLAFPKP